MKKHHWYLILIILFGCVIRFVGIDKPCGLWFDELLTWNISRQAFPFGILHKIMIEDFHFPLYYFILHFWMKLFGDADLIVRLLSYTFGILTIPAAYLAGKKLHDKKTGIITASLVSINSFLIYFSQEVRFYSLLGLLGFLSIYFLLRFIKNPKKLNVVLLTVTNLCILYTNTLAFLFIFSEVAAFSVYFYLHKKDLLKKYFKLQLITLIAFIPGLLMLFHANQAIKSAFIKPFTWWGPFDPFTIISTFQNWFSPLLFMEENGATTYYKFLLLIKAFILFVIAFIPVLICFAIYFYFIKNEKLKSEKSYVFLTGIVLFGILTGLCFLDKFRLIPRYTILCLPSMLLIVGYQLSKIESKKLFTGLIGFLLFINISYLVFIPDSAPKQIRSSGIKYVTTVLEKNKINNNDVIFMPESGIFLPRYYPIKTLSISPFSDFGAYVRGDKSDLKIIMDDKLINSLNPQNSKAVLRHYLTSSYQSSILENYVNNSINSVKKGRYFVMVVPSWVLSRQISINTVENDKTYKNISLYYALMIKTYNDLLAIIKSNRNFELSSKVKIKYWTVFVFQKK